MNNEALESNTNLAGNNSISEKNLQLTAQALTQLDELLQNVNGLNSDDQAAAFTFMDLYKTYPEELVIMYKLFKNYLYRFTKNICVGTTGNTLDELAQDWLNTTGVNIVYSQEDQVYLPLTSIYGCLLTQARKAQKIIDLKTKHRNDPELTKKITQENPEALYPYRLHFIITQLFAATNLDNPAVNKTSLVERKRFLEAKLGINSSAGNAPGAAGVFGNMFSQDGLMGGLMKEFNNPESQQKMSNMFTKLTSEVSQDDDIGSFIQKTIGIMTEGDDNIFGSLISNIGNAINSDRPPDQKIPMAPNELAAKIKAGLGNNLGNLNNVKLGNIGQIFNGGLADGAAISTNSTSQLPPASVNITPTIPVASTATQAVQSSVPTSNNLIDFGKLEITPSTTPSTNIGNLINLD